VDLFLGVEKGTSLKGLTFRIVRGAVVEEAHLLVVITYMQPGIHAFWTDGWNRRLSKTRDGRGEVVLVSVFESRFLQHFYLKLVISVYPKQFPIHLQTDCDVRIAVFPEKLRRLRGAAAAVRIHSVGLSSIRGPNNARLTEE